MHKATACTLVASDLRHRRERWHALARRTSVTRTELPNGLRLAFAAEPGVAEMLEQLVALERECCAFADWVVDGTTLEITAEGDAVPVVRAMFA